MERRVSPPRLGGVGGKLDGDQIARGVRRVEPLDVRPPGVRGGEEPTRQLDQARQRHARLEPITPRLIHVPLDLDVVALAGPRQGVHHHGVAVHHVERRDHEAAERRVAIGDRPHGADRDRGQGGLHVDHRPRRDAGDPLRDGDDAVDGDPIERGIGPEAARRADQIAQALARLHLVDRGAHDGSRHPYARAVHRNEDQVARLEPDVRPRVTP